MNEESAKIIRLSCPCCQAQLWIDPGLEAAIKFERPKKAKSSLDELLFKEKKKKEEADRKFASTAELARQKKKAAQERFAKAIGDLKKQD